MSAVIKNFNLDAAEEVAVVAPLTPPSPPPLPPAKKPKQGIGSILGSDSDHKAKTASAAASIRRTLSADMSSKKWLSQNGFSGSAFPAMKKVASSGEFADDQHHFSGEEDDLSRPGQDEVWRAIQAAQKQLPQDDRVKPALRSCESWSSILASQNTEDSSKLPPPYVHPLVKRRTASSLNEKSLEICTESLGSETGSDGFSSHSPPESGDEEEEEKEDHHLQITNYSHSFEAQALKHSYSKRSPPRSFPPPLPSLAKNKASLQVLSRRQNGRLILEAVSVPPRDYLHAQRHDGRLLLTLVNGSGSEEASREETGDKDEATQVFDSFEETDDTVFSDDDEEEDDEQELTKEMGINSNLPNMRAPPFMKQFKKNTLWFNNKAVDLMEEEEEEEDLIITPLPPPPPAGVAGLIPAALPHAAAFVNTYDYFWRKKPTVASVIIDTEQCKGGATNNLKNSNNNVVESPKVAAYEQKDSVVLLRGSMANNILRGCKESRRSLLPWEPYCIATT